MIVEESLFVLFFKVFVKNEKLKSIYYTINAQKNSIIK